MTMKATPFDPAEYLDTPEAQREFPRESFESGDAQEIVKSIRIVACAFDMTQTAYEAGVDRESLYKTLSPEDNPKFGTIVRVLKALGLMLTVEAADG